MGFAAMRVVRRGRQEKPREGECQPEPIPEATWCNIGKLLPYPAEKPVSPDTVLREFLGLGLATYAHDQGLTDAVYLDYPARTQRLTAAQQRATLQDLGTWAVLTLRNGVGFPQIFPRGTETRLVRLLLNRVLSRHPRWWDVRHLPFSDPAARGLLRGDLVLVAERAPWWAARIRDPRGPRPNLAFSELVSCCIRAIEGRGKKPTLTWNHTDKRVTGLLYELVAELLPWIPELAALTPHGQYKVLEKARQRAQQFAQQL
jgi:hypothetical protein